METSPPKSPKKKPLDNLSMMRYASMGTQMIVIMALFTFGGYKLDQWFHTKIPFITIIMSLLGVVVALYLAVKDLLKKK